MSSQSTALGTAAEERKARLAKLKNLKRKQPDDEIVPPKSERENSAPDITAPASSAPRNTMVTQQEIQVAVNEEQQNLEAESTISEYLSGRTYDPETRGPKLGFDTAPSDMTGRPTLEEQAHDIETTLKEERAADEAAALREQQELGVHAGESIDLFKLQPRRANWDLKRDLGERLRILDVRTQNAVNALVRRRIEEGRKKATAASEMEKIEVKNGNGSVEADGIDGAELVEGLRVREREEEEEQRREREEIEGMV